jgi:hypothetical protein
MSTVVLNRNIPMLRYCVHGDVFLDQWRNPYTEFRLFDFLECRRNAYALLYIIVFEVQKISGGDNLSSYALRYATSYAGPLQR